MESLNYKYGHTAEVMNKITEVLKWLESKGVNVKSCRYSKYVAYIDEFYKNRDGLEENFENLNWAFKELFEIVQVYNAFKEEDSKDFNNRIKKIVQGQDLIPKSLEVKHDVSRDFLYELLIGVYFKSLGYEIEFNEEKADIVAKRSNIEVFIECKRIKSEKRLEENLKKAFKQLSKREGKNVCGLVFVDIANCIFDKIRRYEYSNILEMREIVKNAMYKYLNNHNGDINKLEEKFCNDALGSCFTMFNLMWLSDGSIQYYRAFEAKSINNISDELFGIFEGILQKENI